MICLLLILLQLRMKIYVFWMVPLYLSTSMFVLIKSAGEPSQWHRGSYLCLVTLTYLLHRHFILWLMLHFPMDILFNRKRCLFSQWCFLTATDDCQLNSSVHLMCFHGGCLILFDIIGIFVYVFKWEDCNPSASEKTAILMHSVAACIDEQPKTRAKFKHGCLYALTCVDLAYLYNYNYLC